MTPSTRNLRSRPHNLAYSIHNSTPTTDKLIGSTHISQQAPAFYSSRPYLFVHNTQIRSSYSSFSAADKPARSASPIPYSGGAISGGPSSTYFGGGGSAHSAYFGAGYGGDYAWPPYSSPTAHRFANPLYKTQLCKSYAEKGECSFNER